MLQYWSKQHRIISKWYIYLICILIGWQTIYALWPQQTRTHCGSNIVTMMLPICGKTRQHSGMACADTRSIAEVFQDHFFMSRIQNIFATMLRVRQNESKCVLTVSSFRPNTLKSTGCNYITLSFSFIHSNQPQSPTEEASNKHSRYTMESAKNINNKEGQDLERT